MRKIFLLTALLFQMAFVLGQTYSSSNPQFQWGVWTQVASYPGIYVRAQKAYFNKGANQWYWNWEIQNRYSKKVAISWKFYNRNENQFIDGTSQRHTFSPNEIRRNGSFGAEDILSYIFDNICFEFKHVNGIELENCSPTNSNNSSTNQTNTSNSSNNTSIDALNEERLELCRKISEYTKSNIICENSGVGTMINSTKYSSQQKVQILNDEIARLKKILNGYDQNVKKEEERLQAQSEVWKQKTADFTSLINDGDAELRNEKYDAAISKYNEAKNLYTGQLAPQETEYAKSAIPLANGRIAAAEKAKADAARKVRVAEAKERDRREDIGYSAMAGGALGLMGMLTDRYIAGRGYFKLRAGVGIENTPLILNDSLAGNSSATGESLHPTIHIAFNIGLMNKRFVKWNLNPEVNYGISAFSSGKSGGFIKAGGMSFLELRLPIMRRTGSQLSIYGAGGWFSNAGDYTIDHDASDGTATDNVQAAHYSYSYYTYGGGLQYRYISDNAKETVIRPGLFIEKHSFANTTNYSAMLHLNIANAIILEAKYTKNAPIAGYLKFPGNFDAQNKDYYSITIIRQGAF